MLPNYQARSPFVLKHTTSLYIMFGHTYVILYFDLLVLVLALCSTPSQTSLSGILQFIDHYPIQKIELFTALNSFAGAVKTQKRTGVPFLFS